MRVLLSVYSCHPNQGREQGSGWNCALHLAQLGHNVWALTRSQNRHDIEQAFAARSLTNLHFIYVDDHPWLTQVACSNGRLQRYLKRTLEKISYLLWQRQAYQTAIELDRQHNFDVVHHVTMGVITGGSLLWRLNKPFIMGPVGGGQVAPPQFKAYFQHWWSSEARRSFLIQSMIPLNPALRQAMQHTSLVLATNRETAALAKRLGAPSVELFLDNGLPQDRVPPTIPPRSVAPELRLLWVAVLEPRKGLTLALEALSKLDSTIPYKLTILGSGTQTPYLPALIEHYQLHGKVEPRGYVSWQAVFEAYHDHDVLLFPSLRDSFGVQLVEAMSQGMPVITLDHQGAGDFVPADAGIKVPVTTPAETVQALADAIAFLYHHPQRRLEMGQAGYEFAKTQTWEKRAMAISSFYDTVASHPQHTAVATVL